MSASNPHYKGSLSTLILKLIAENQRMYGYEIGKSLGEISGGNFRISEAALYQSLHRLEGDGILEAEIDNSGSRPRKYYALTKKGKGIYAKQLQFLTDYLRQMAEIVNLKPTLK